MNLFPICMTADSLATTMPRGSKEKKKRDMERSPVTELSDDLLVEIISRVPYKSTRCCKCVCRRWRDLVSHPDQRKKLPRSTLAGFFYEIYRLTGERHVNRGYQSVSGNWRPHNDLSLSFLSRCERPYIELLDSCNGLLLCRCWKRKGVVGEILDYVVCNPATEQWVSVPATEWSGKVLHARLGFDPAVSSHFHVFQFGPAGERSKAVGIYSSKARAWTHRTAWDRPIKISGFSASAFFNGAMYLTPYDDRVVAVVDLEGNLRVIPSPKKHDAGAGSGVYLSRGKLYLAYYGASGLSIWALEDSSSENWIMKHNVSHLQLFGKESSCYVLAYRVIIHPEENVIFIQGLLTNTIRQPSVMKLMSYEMDSRELHFMCDLESGCMAPYFQYVPFLSESLADGH